MAAIFGVACTVLLGTCIGFPISTTHRLVGALTGAGMVSFARGLNDTPKIAALIIMTGSLSKKVSLIFIGFLMATRGWFHSKRIA